MKLNNNDDSHNSGLNLLIYNMLLDIESHPAWVCGLKPALPCLYTLFTSSHPAWVCGLKHLLLFTNSDEVASHPAWVCGLKLRYCHDKSWKFGVTPCVGVWIETLKKVAILLKTRSHTLRGCVD